MVLTLPLKPGRRDGSFPTPPEIVTSESYYPSPFTGVCVSRSVMLDSFCDPTDCSPPGSSVHEILQARILEWVAIPFSRGSSQPRDQTQVSHIAGNSLPAESQGKPKNTVVTSLSFSSGYSRQRNQTRVSCMAGGFFTS